MLQLKIEALVEIRRAIEGSSSIPIVLLFTLQSKIELL